MKEVKVFLIGVVSIVVMTFGFGALDLGMLKIFGVARENVKREIFEQTKSHVHGTIKNISRMRLEYKTSSDEAHRAALKEMILTETSSFDINQLPIDLQTFVRSL